jgi:hypothetical protein
MRGKIKVTEIHREARRNKIAFTKVCYLLAVTAITFMVPAFGETRPAGWFIVPALLVLQILILLACRIRAPAVVRPVWRLKWLFLLLIGAYALLPAEGPSSLDTFLAWHIPAVEWTLSINLTGIERAGLMCLQIITLLLASSVVRLTGTGRDLVEGLETFRLPRLFVYSLDHTLDILGGTRRRSGRGGRGAGREGISTRLGFFTVLRGLFHGDIGALVESVHGNINLADTRTGGDGDRDPGARLAHDVAIVSGIALCMASFKMLKVLPGVPFASGHKALLLFPLYILASRLTYSRWGATAAGSVMGVVGFLQGDGRFGVLEILKHLAPGVVIDLAEPLVRRLPRWALGYCLLGLAAAVARTATEFALVAMLGARAEVYIFPAAKLVPNLLAGSLSGLVSVFVLRAFERSIPPRDEMSVESDSRIPKEPGDAADPGLRTRRAAAEESHLPAPTAPAKAGDQE